MTRSAMLVLTATLTLVLGGGASAQVKRFRWRAPTVSACTTWRPSQPRFKARRGFG